MMQQRGRKGQIMVCVSVCYRRQVMQLTFTSSYQVFENCTLAQRSRENIFTHLLHNTVIKTIHMQLQCLAEVFTPHKRYQILSTINKLQCNLLGFHVVNQHRVAHKCKLRVYFIYFIFFTKKVS